MERIPRPKVVASLNVRATTACGNMYVQMGWWSGGLHEVFATLGRAGGCPMCFNESLTRTITTGLRCGVPMAEYIRQLRGVRCPSPMPFPKEDSVLSCPDALAKTLEEYGLLTVSGMISLIQRLSSEPVQPSEEEEIAEAIKHIDELKEERAKQDL